MGSKYEITVEIPEGYTVIKRTWPEPEPDDKVIVWWEKGDEPNTYFKCDGVSPDGLAFEEMGDTVDEALTRLFEYF